MSDTFIPSKFHRLPDDRCQVCGHTFTAATSTTGDPRTPERGDVTLCYECGEVFLYDQDIRLVKPNENEWKSIRDDPEMYAHIREMQQAIRERRVKLIRIEKP